MKRPIILQPDLVEERDGRHLLIWGDVPHWIVADDEVLELIRLADGSRTMNDIAARIADSTGSSPDGVLSDSHSVMQQLERGGVAATKGRARRSVSRRPVLENVTINVTRRCNLRCAHCFLDRPIDLQERLNVYDLKRFLEEGKGYLAKGLNFSILGGEPLLAKEKTLEIAKMARTWGGETVVSTNGLLVDREFARRAKELELKVQVSMEGSTPEMNDRIRGRGSFQKAVRGVEVLVESGTYTILSTVVQRDNLGDVEAMFELSERLGTDEVRYIPLTLMGRARTMGLEPVRNVELLHALLALLASHPSAKGRMKRDYLTILRTVCSLSNRRLYCGTGLKTILVDADGETYPCPNHQFPEFRCGKIAERTFREIWLDSPILRKVRAIYDIEAINGECSKCAVRHWCMGGCRGETYENTGDMRARSVRCEDLRTAVIEMMWAIGTGSGTEAEDGRLEYF